ncbi:MAG: YggS family pyridoxal phosphate enzyme [Spirochaetes bacterium GWF1_41_5]|nr:MAG: YggS family pyridoxal phosphate enzyme [Spirochaetes bacterium GWF1_41_5]HBE04294.1 YggS family pyridoxal phosphate-dependent enzyme [Spirochaetia bacterium]
MSYSLIEENYRRLRGIIPEHVSIIAVSKTRTADEILEVINAGAEHIGENYLQEALPKINAIGPRVKWHMIGHLQSNKISKVLPHFNSVQTVHSVKTATQLDRQAQTHNCRLEIMLEINIGYENSKHGFLPEQCRAAAIEISKMKNLALTGLMCLEPYTENSSEAKKYFLRMKELFNEISDITADNNRLRHLSMGLSHSWPWAVDCGASMVRIGTAIFGGRK